MKIQIKSMKESIDDSYTKVLSKLGELQRQGKFPGGSIVGNDIDDSLADNEILIKGDDGSDIAGFKSALDQLKGDSTIADYFVNPDDTIIVTLKESKKKSKKESFIRTYNNPSEKKYAQLTSDEDGTDIEITIYSSETDKEVGEDKYFDTLKDAELWLGDKGFFRESKKSKKESDYDFNQGTYQQGYDWGFEAYQGHKRQLSDSDWESGTFSEDFYDGYHDGWNDAIEEENYNHPGYTENKKKSKKESSIESLLKRSDYSDNVEEYTSDSGWTYTLDKDDEGYAGIIYDSEGDGDPDDMQVDGDFSREGALKWLQEKFEYYERPENSPKQFRRESSNRKRSKKESSSEALKKVKERVKKEFPDFEVKGPVPEVYDNAPEGRDQYLIAVPDDSTEGREVEKMLREIESEYPDSFEYEGVDWDNRYWFNIPKE